MELSDVTCKVKELPDRHLIEVTATVNFHHVDAFGDYIGPERMQTGFDYIPAEFPESETVQSHEGEPSPQLIDWLESVRPYREDWQELDEEVI